MKLKITQLIFLLTIMLGLSSCGLLNKLSVGPDAKAYSEAWASRDVNNILAFHDDDSIFHLHLLNEPIAKGREEIKAAFKKVFKLAPDYRSKAQEIYFSNDSVTARYIVTATPTEPFVFGKKRFIPTGNTYELELIDVIEFKGGLVTEKHTYMDLEALIQYSQSVETLN